MNDFCFASLKAEIRDVLQNSSNDFGIREQVTLFDGFLSFPVANSTDELALFAKETIPAIMLIGKSGQLYFLSLKILLPHKTC